MVGVTGLVISGGYLLLRVCDRYQCELDVRVGELTSSSDKRGAAIVAARPAASALVWPFASQRARLLGGDEPKNLQARFLQAGLYHPIAVSIFFTVKVSLTLVPLIACPILHWQGALKTGPAILAACGVVLCGQLLPSLWLEARIRSRHTALRRSLADFLDLMIVCLESGLSLEGTIQRVSDELRTAHPMLAGELSTVQRDIDLGTAIPNAFRRFADRSGFAGIRSLSNFLRESQRFGTELASALRLHSEMLRNQREQSAEESAQKASVKILIPTLLLILPAVFVVLAGPAWIQIQAAFSK